jgi:hypothetical protein
MAWRAMNSILVLRNQVNLIAPNRNKGADGTVCDQNHPTTSDHCPHNVPGVGSEMVTALDLTHDPDGGFDSYKFAEVLRIHRDARIKYVISNKRMFSSYATSSYPAWTWRPYSGEDLHTNHVHVSVLDAPISDTSTLWDLEGFVTDPMWLEEYTGAFFAQAMAELADMVKIPAADKTKVVGGYGGYSAVVKAVALWKKIDSQASTNGGTLSTLLDSQKRIEARLAAMDEKLDRILAGGSGGAATGGTFNGTWTANF